MVEETETTVLRSGSFPQTHESKSTNIGLNKGCLCFGAGVGVSVGVGVAVSVAVSRYFGRSHFHQPAWWPLCRDWLGWALVQTVPTSELVLAAPPSQQQALTATAA